MSPRRESPDRPQSPPETAEPARTPSEPQREVLDSGAFVEVTYMQRFGEAKAELLRRAADAVQSPPAVLGTADGALGGFLADYYRDLEFPDLAERTPENLACGALAHLRGVTSRPHGSPVVRVGNPELDRDGWTSPHTVIDLAIDDMPFLVDSVVAELQRNGRSVQLVVHPVVTVRRDPNGLLYEVHDEPDDLGPGLTRESWIHVEVDLEPDPAAHRQIEKNLLRVLADVTASYDDWHPMRDRALALAEELRRDPPPVPAEDADDVVVLLEWLADDNFTFLGYREYDLVEADDVAPGEPEGPLLRAVPGSGLGLLRGDDSAPRSLARLAPEVRAKVREKRLLVLTKANSRSTVHRRVYLDYVGIKRFGPDGEVVGERRFIGLFSAGAYTLGVRSVPFLRRKVDEVLELSGYPPESHNAKDLLTFLDTYPRDELFQLDAADVLPVAMQVMHIQERRQVRTFLRRDVYGRFVSCVVYLPRDRYSTTVRLAMADILNDTFDPVALDYTALVSESDLARLHFVARLQRGAAPPDLDLAALEARFTAAARTWLDDLADALAEAHGDSEAAVLLRRYGDGVPAGYTEDFPPRSAVSDIRRIEAMGEPGSIAVHLYEPPGAAEGEYRFKVYREGGAVPLSTALPILQHIGVDMVDENVYDWGRNDGTVVHVHDIGFRFLAESDADHETLAERFEQTFVAVWCGDAESDGLNALVPTGGLTWPEVAVLRGYAKYLRQAGSTFSRDYVEQSVVTNNELAVLLVRLFETRHDPRLEGDRAAQSAELVSAAEAALERVESLDHDRILRSFLALVQATLRTSWYQRDEDGRPHPYTAYKLDPHAIPDLPRPLPRHEIWVYAPTVEGVHLRFGAVARGGLRWSDRLEDFRTEVLGLVKAQAVKNALIVPTGAKGGFVVKNPTADPGDREAVVAEGIASYRIFIEAMLDVTDNLLGGEVVPPVDVVRHDGDDTYLVVAADKGTARFSDIANEISMRRGFWLGDAFASGGSAGYDHKAMGITARGGWESVKRHFRERGVDTQAEDFTAVGIGDMSGDVFGNGMLRSEHIRLVAAFDHRHVFVDPDPDAAAGFAERRRLYDLPRSSWADYDPALISAGGGVFARTAKSVDISPQMQAALGLEASVVTLTPTELIRAVLRAPVDLLWNGGIGTYVKAGSETNLDVGDKSTDAVRIDGAELRCAVVGEGGNLGFTQRGRIEAARAGIRINTDAIDNSAGVDTSDHEVNLKIVLDHVVREGGLDPAERDPLLHSVSDDVAALVLEDNYDQNVLLGVARAQAASMLPVHQRLLRALEDAGDLDRAIEFLPTDHEIEALLAAGAGLASPELAVLVAYVKMWIKDEVLGTSLPDEPWAAVLLRRYFPDEVVRRLGDALDAHPLRRELVTTSMVNGLVDAAGSSFVFRAVEETGADVDDVVRAFAVVREVFGLAEIWSRINGLDNLVPTDAQDDLWLQTRRLLDRGTRWMLAHRAGRIDVDSDVARFVEVQALLPKLPSMLRGAEAERLAAHTERFIGLGVPADLAGEVAVLLDGFTLLDIAEIALRTGSPADEVGHLYCELSDRYDVDTFLGRITALPRMDRWSALARSSLRYDLYGAVADITEKVLLATPSGASPEDRIEQWQATNAQAISRSRATLAEIAATDSFDLATLSVALRAIRNLAAATD